MPAFHACGRLALVAGRRFAFTTHAFPASPPPSPRAALKKKKPKTADGGKPVPTAAASPKARAKSPAARGAGTAKPPSKSLSAAAAALGAPAAPGDRAVGLVVGPVPGGVSGSSDYCVCHSSDEGFMVECSDGTGGCGGWFHPECCNLELTPEQRQKSEWCVFLLCVVCVCVVVCGGLGGREEEIHRCRDSRMAREE